MGESLSSPTLHKLKTLVLPTRMASMQSKTDPYISTGNRIFFGRRYEDMKSKKNKKNKKKKHGFSSFSRWSSAIY